MPQANAQVAPSFSGFFAWWKRELREIFGPRQPRGPEFARRRFVIDASSDSIRWLRESDQGRKPIGLETTTLDPTVATLGYLRRKARKRRPVPLGLRLPKNQCLERRVRLPTAARADFASILNLDIERATPFRRGDVYTAFVEDKDAPRVAGKTALRHLIVKRALIDDGADALRKHGLTLAFADCWDETGAKPLRVNFLAPPPLPPAPPSRAVRVLSAATLALAALAMFLAVDRYETALATLETRIAEATRRAEAVRARITGTQARLGELSDLQALKTGRPSPAALLAELTRILPDGTHLNELRLSADRISIAGLSDKAVALVPLIEQSQMLEGVEITAPVQLDQTSGKEMFRIQARVATEKRTVREDKPVGHSVQADTGAPEPVP